MQSDTGREALRQKSVSDVFEGNRAVESAKYLQAETRRIGTEAYLKEHPEIEFEYASALEKIKKAKTPEELDFLRAQAEHARATGRLNDASASEIYTLTDAKKSELSAHTKLLEEQGGAYMDFTLDGKTYRGSTNDVLDFLVSKSAGDTGADSEKAAVILEEKIAGFENTMLSNPNSPATQAYSEFVNKYSDKPYIYVYNPKWGGNNLERIPIPSIGGNRISSRQLFAMKFLAEHQLGRTIEWNDFFKIATGNSMPKGTVVRSKQSGPNEPVIGPMGPR